MRRLPFLAWLAPPLLGLGLLCPVLLGTTGCRAGDERASSAIVLEDRLPAPQLLPGGTTHYALTARLDAQRHEVEGSGTITWTNRSDLAVSELYLHLYLNAFRKGSLFLRGSGGRSGGLVGREGSIEIRHLRSPTFDGVDLWPGADQHSPGDPADQTDLRVPLPRAVRPGESVELRVDFLSVLPEIVERTGFAGDYHLLGQWFPKLARLEEDGTWAHFPFHAFAEFYSDFDDYEVILDVPEAHVVGATGRLTSLERSEKGRARYLAQAESVVDFAWTSSPALERETRRFGGTSVHLLMGPGEPAVRRAHFETLEHGLFELGRWLGEYPYPELTVIVPPANAERSGGMEYPSLITTGGGEMATQLGIRAVELLVIHELAHQWFQSLVATNEPKYPFLDEGLASYAEWRFLESRYGTGSLASLLGLRLSRTAGGRFGAFYGRGAPVAINQPAQDFPSFSSLAREIYCRTPLVLETLARVHGRKRLDSAIAAYARNQRGGHPTPHDFYAVLADYLGDDQLPNLHELFDRASHFNLRVASLETKPKAGEFESSLVIQRSGSPGLPYEVAVNLVGGSPIRLQSNGMAAKETLTFRHRQPISLVLLDPDERLLIDEDPIDDRLDPRTDGLSNVTPDAFLSALTTGLELSFFGLSP